MHLRVMSLFDCAIKHASWLLQLPCLVEIMVYQCQLMEQLVDTTTLPGDLFKDQVVVYFPHLSKLTLQLLSKLYCISDTNYELGRLSYLQVHVCIVLKSLYLQPHTKQTKITLWCLRNWWGQLAWHTDVMKTYLIPTCSIDK